MANVFLALCQPPGKDYHQCITAVKHVATVSPVHKGHMTISEIQLTIHSVPNKIKPFFFRLQTRDKLCPEVNINILERRLVSFC